MRKVVVFILVIFSSFFFYQCGQRQVDQTTQQKQTPKKTAEYLLDTLITKQIPLTVDGDWATINYHLKVKDWNKPVEWTFVVVKEGDTIYSKHSNDKWIDSLFNDDDYYSTDTGGYFANKKGWYLKSILSFNSDTITGNDKKDSLKDFSRKHMLTRFGDNGKDQLNNWRLFWKYYEGKPVITYIFYDAPECDPAIMVYYPRFKKFISVYAP